MGTDLLLLLVAVLAGAFSVLTPCVLVMLPAILAVSGGEGRRRVAGVLIGLEVSFVGISLLAAAAFDALGLPPRTQELVAVVIIGLLGLTMLVPARRGGLEMPPSRLVGRVPGLAAATTGGDGFRGGLLGGLGLGLVWAPCAGPILAAITAGSVSDGFSARTVLMSIGFGLGMLGPLLLVLKGGHGMVARLRRRVGARQLDLVLGGAMIVTAVLIAGGGFTSINRTIAEKVDLTSTPIASFEQDALEDARKDDLAAVRSDSDGSDRPSEQELEIAGYPESEPGELSDFGPAPKLTGINETYNLPDGAKLDDAFLEDKVVVYDFWTYTCINCIRTLPYLRKLHDRYAKDGLVIVGVHAPEFAIEKDEGNVRKAIRNLEVTWPVATDPDLDTWNAFHNHYWPAKYIADRDGNLRYTHFGEGGYEETEAVIRELLGKDPSGADMPAEPDVDFVSNTPETYLGFQRMSDEQYRGVDRASKARIAEGAGEYAIAGRGQLDRNQFAFVGPWKIEGERSVATGDGAELDIHYRARRVYLVVNPGEAGSADIVVHDGDRGGDGGTRTIHVTASQLYPLREGKATADATMRVEVPKGASVYAFTFG
jgi:cytochrome c biogenesis protein CcdA/thiol-disulfide isomerase/thioredoxin